MSKFAHLLYLSPPAKSSALILSMPAFVIVIWHDVASCLLPEILSPNKVLEATALQYWANRLTYQFCAYKWVLRATKE